MKDNELINAICVVTEGMAKTFSAQCALVVESFSNERMESRQIFRELNASSEERLTRANMMVANFAKSADQMSELSGKIAHEYTDHIQRLANERRSLTEVVSQQQSYIRVLQGKIDDRDEHIKSLHAQICQLTETNASLIRRLTAGPIVQNDFGVHH